MKCTRCKAEAAVSLPSHNSAFCPACYLDFFTKQVEKGIQKQKLFTHDDTILVALSGGKDSLALMLELHSLGYQVTGLHIDLDIPGSSRAARMAVENFCTLHGLPYMVKEMKKEGLPIPLIKQNIRRPVCSVCGSIKRYYFNKVAVDEGFTVLATGHNLDDEVARLFSNTLRWDSTYLADQGPALEASADGGFVRKVKPLWRLTEFETANYAFLKGIAIHSAPCPYSKGASFTFYKGLWEQLENHMPGRKIAFYQDFLSKGRPAFSSDRQKEGVALAPCDLCGSPTSAGTCSICRIKSLLPKNAENLLEDGE